MKCLLTLAFSLTLLCGCVAVPQTRIDYGKLHIRAPKDTDLSGLQITQMTNGAVQVTLQAYKARMNPDVIQQSAAGQAQLIGATGQAVGGAMGEMLLKVMAAYGLKPPVAQPSPPPQ